MFVWNTLFLQILFETFLPEWAELSHYVYNLNECAKCAKYLNIYIYNVISVLQQLACAIKLRYRYL